MCVIRGREGCARVGRGKRGDFRHDATVCDTFVRIRQWACLGTGRFRVGVWLEFAGRESGEATSRRRRVVFKEAASRRVLL